MIESLIWARKQSNCPAHRSVLSSGISCLCGRMAPDWGREEDVGGWARWGALMAQTVCFVNTCCCSLINICFWCSLLSVWTIRLSISWVLVAVKVMRRVAHDHLSWIRTAPPLWRAAACAAPLGGSALSSSSSGAEARRGRTVVQV